MKLASLIAGLIWVWSTAVAVAAVLPDIQGLRLEYRVSDITVLDRYGVPVQRLRADFDDRRGDWLALDDISPALIEAVIQSEDQRFYAHNGVDFQAVGAVLWGQASGSAPRGASTLTMQLAGLVDARYRRPEGGRGVLAKLDQMLYAQALERRWRKEHILEAYLNLAPFRGELIGVDALSRVLFQKHASGLDARESAVAAAMLRGPNVSINLLARRACGVLRQMREGADCHDMLRFIEASLRHTSAPRSDRLDLAPHFSRWAVEQALPEAGQRLHTSLDSGLQREVLDIVERRLHELSSSNIRDVAVVVLDNNSGEVLAYVGSSGGWSDAPWVDHVRSLRQAGSTLKPFLYQQAIEQQRLTPVSLLEDGPLNLPTGSGLYIPRNYDERFSGWVSVRTALASSLNIPAVRALTMVTPDEFRDRLVTLGLPLQQSGDYYGYSLALGSADVSLLSLTNAYRVLANLGWTSAPQLFPQGTPVEKRRVMKAAAAWIVGDILADPHARARTFGLDGPLVTPFWTAVKTGTSKDMRDNWTLGWSEHYTVGVWAGNSSGDSMRNVSGVTGAGPVWNDIMSYLHARRGSRQPSRPGQVSRERVSFENDVEAVRDEYFVGDTALTYVRQVADMPGSRPAAHITAPADGTILALDPDIPPANQRVVFRALGSGPIGWRVGEEPAVWADEMMWMPVPGRHRVELLNQDGSVLDSVTLTVRGAATVVTAP